MRLLTKLVTCGGVAAFFFFSWVIMMLWNSILAGHLGLLPVLNYLQAAGLWFLFILFFAWTGIGVNGRVLPSWRKERTWDKTVDRIESKIRHGIFHWGERKNEENWEELGDKIEKKVKRGIAHWVDADPDMEWDDLGKSIEEKMKRKVREWADEG